MNVSRSMAAAFGLLRQSSVYLTLIGGICLISIVFIVTAGVIMRYAFAAPLLGINEIVQLTAVALVMSALPYCTVQEDHVAVDVFEKWLGRPGRFIGDVLSRALSGLILALLCRRAVLRTLDAWEFSDSTNMLRMPIWPFYAILAAGAGLCALIFAMQLVMLFFKGARS